MNWWRTDDELMTNWWWTDDELMRNCWRTDDELVMNWWWTDEELMMNWWWTDNELMMNWRWTDDELMITDYHRLQLTDWFYSIEHSNLSPDHTTISLTPPTTRAPLAVLINLYWIWTAFVESKDHRVQCEGTLHWGNPNHRCLPHLWHLWKSSEDQGSTERAQV